MDTLCPKCSNSIKSNYIACHICKVKFHFVCAKIDNPAFCQLMVDNKNIVLNCDDCLKASSDVKSSFSSLSQELRELKQIVLSSLCVDVNDLKQKFNELSKNLEKPIPHKKVHNVNKQNASAVNNDCAVSNVLSVRTEMDKGDNDAASIMSVSSQLSEVRSNTHDGWTTVRRKRRNRVIAVGENDSTELDVAVKMKFLHISSFKTSVTEDQIIAYIEKKAEISKQHIVCNRLVKKDVDVNSLKHVNFKIGVSPCFYAELTKPSLWPTDVKIRPFIFLEKKPAELPKA